MDRLVYLLTNLEAQVSARAKQQKSTPLRRPTCTHIVMNKSYGTDDKCHICDQYPPLGWIYVCQQDTQYPVGKPELVDTGKRLSASDLAPDASSLELLGCHKTVIDAAKAGHYTEEQIKIIIGQKINVRDTIAAQLQQINSRPLPKLPTNSSKPKQSKLKKEGPLMKEGATSASNPEVFPVAPAPTCDFKCCFNCRPLSRDRAVSSFESVLKEPNEILRPWDPNTQPVAKASIVGNINPWPVSRENAGSIFERPTPDAREEEEIDFSPMLENTSYVDMLRYVYSRQSLETYDTQEEAACRGFRSSWKKALDDMLRVRQATSRSLDVARGRQRNALQTYYEDEEEEQRGGSISDLELFKRLSEDVQREASNVSLPSPDETSLHESNNPYETSQAEKHVKGGIAVTEEAIENEAPDIITAV